MKFEDYSDVKRFIFDKELIDLLCYNRKFGELLDYFVQDDFLEIKENMKLPFFAEIRDYQGAVEKSNEKAEWLVKEAKGHDLIETEMAMIVYFLDMFTHTLSVPMVVTKIDGKVYRATKTINQAEQLSGSNYTVFPDLTEPLLLDMINRWIYYDEDRNPNNYMIKYNSKNKNLILAIDFGNTDLLYKQIKIRGTSNKFGWERKEKTRYLTPLKADNFKVYDMQFYNQRFKYFNKLTGNQLFGIAKKALRYNDNKDELAKTITTNLLKRRDYVYKYFCSKIPAVIEKDESYKDMGAAFQNFYG
jgi:hypothetical protein